MLILYLFALYNLKDGYLTMFIMVSVSADLINQVTKWTRCLPLHGTDYVQGPITRSNIEQ
jgi:hypothetical protein